MQQCVKGFREHTTPPVEDNQAVIERMHVSVLSDTTKQVSIVQTALPLSMEVQDVDATVSCKTICCL